MLIQWKSEFISSTSKSWIKDFTVTGTGAIEMIINNSHWEQVAYAEGSHLTLSEKEYLFFYWRSCVYLLDLWSKKQNLKMNESVLYLWRCFLYYMLFTVGIMVTLHGQVHMTKPRPHLLNCLQPLLSCFLMYAVVAPFKKRFALHWDCETFLKNSLGLIKVKSQGTLCFST